MVQRKSFGRELFDLSLLVVVPFAIYYGLSAFFGLHLVNIDGLQWFNSTIRTTILSSYGALLPQSALFAALAVIFPAIVYTVSRLLDRKFPSAEKILRYATFAVLLGTAAVFFGRFFPIPISPAGAAGAGYTTWFRNSWLALAEALSGILLPTAIATICALWFQSKLSGSRVAAGIVLIVNAVTALPFWIAMARVMSANVPGIVTAFGFWICFNLVFVFNIMVITGISEILRHFVDYLLTEITRSKRGRSTKTVAQVHASISETPATLSLSDLSSDTVGGVISRINSETPYGAQAPEKPEKDAEKTQTTEELDVAGESTPPAAEESTPEAPTPPDTDETTTVPPEASSPQIEVPAPAASGDLEKDADAAAFSPAPLADDRPAETPETHTAAKPVTPPAREKGYSMAENIGKAYDELEPPTPDSAFGDISETHAAETSTQNESPIKVYPSFEDMTQNDDSPAPLADAGTTAQQDAPAPSFGVQEAPEPQDAFKPYPLTDSLSIDTSPMPSDDLVPLAPSAPTETPSVSDTFAPYSPETPAAPASEPFGAFDLFAAQDPPPEQPAMPPFPDITPAPFDTDVSQSSLESAFKPYPLFDAPQETQSEDAPGISNPPATGFDDFGNFQNFEAFASTDPLPQPTVPAHDTGIQAPSQPEEAPVNPNADTFAPTTNGTFDAFGNFDMFAAPEQAPLSPVQQPEIPSSAVSPQETGWPTGAAEQREPDNTAFEAYAPTQDTGTQQPAPSPDNPNADLPGASSPASDFASFESPVTAEQPLSPDLPEAKAMPLPDPFAAPTEDTLATGSAFDMFVAPDGAPEATEQPMTTSPPPAPQAGAPLPLGTEAPGDAFKPYSLLGNLQVEPSAGDSAAAFGDEFGFPAAAQPTEHKQEPAFKPQIIKDGTPQMPTKSPASDTAFTASYQDIAERPLETPAASQQHAAPNDNFKPYSLLGNLQVEPNAGDSTSSFGDEFGFPAAPQPIEHKQEPAFKPQIIKDGTPHIPTKSPASDTAFTSSYQDIVERPLEMPAAPQQNTAAGDDFKPYPLLGNLQVEPNAGDSTQPFGDDFGFPSAQPTEPLQDPGFKPQIIKENAPHMPMRSSAAHSSAITSSYQDIVERPAETPPTPTLDAAPSDDFKPYSLLGNLQVEQEKQQKASDGGFSLSTHAGASKSDDFADFQNFEAFASNSAPQPARPADVPRMPQPTRAQDTFKPYPLLDNLNIDAPAPSFAADDFSAVQTPPMPPLADTPPARMPETHDAPAEKSFDAFDMFATPDPASAVTEQPVAMPAAPVPAPEAPAADMFAPLQTEETPPAPNPVEAIKEEVAAVPQPDATREAAEAPVSDMTPLAETPYAAPADAGFGSTDTLATPSSAPDDPFSLDAFFKPETTPDTSNTGEGVPQTPDDAAFDFPAFGENLPPYMPEGLDDFSFKPYTIPESFGENPSQPLSADTALPQDEDALSGGLSQTAVIYPAFEEDAFGAPGEELPSTPPPVFLLSQRPDEPVADTETALPQTEAPQPDTEPSQAETPQEPSATDTPTTTVTTESPAAGEQLPSPAMPEVSKLPEDKPENGEPDEQKKTIDDALTESDLKPVDDIAEDEKKNDSDEPPVEKKPYFEALRHKFESSALSRKHGAKFAYALAVVALLYILYFGFNWYVDSGEAGRFAEAKELSVTTFDTMDYEASNEHIANALAILDAHGENRRFDRFDADKTLLLDMRQWMQSPRIKVEGWHFKAMPKWYRYFGMNFSGMSPVLKFQLQSKSGEKLYEQVMGQNITGLLNSQPDAPAYLGADDRVVFVEDNYIADVEVFSARAEGLLDLKSKFSEATGAENPRKRTWQIKAFSRDKEYICDLAIDAEFPAAQDISQFR